MKKKGSKLKWIVIIVIVIAAISMATKGGNNDSSTEIQKVILHLRKRKILRKAKRKK